MVHINPPYRCDVVGSFLRPKTVAQARVKFSCGQISKEELTAIEDAEIKKLIAKELENGLSAVTDGEFRRAYWHLDFLAALGGIRHVKADAWSVHFEGHQPKAETIVIADRIRFPETIRFGSIRSSEGSGRRCAHQVHNSFAFDAAPDLLRARRKL